MPLQHIRSGTADKRPVATNLADGQIAINYHVDSPGLFVKDTNNTLAKIGPIHVGTTAPNASPAGSSGNSKGEGWLDTSGANAVLKIWNGSSWITASSVASGNIVTTVDTGTVTSAMIADLTIVNGDISASAAIAHNKLASITAGQVLLGNASNVPTATTLSGDVTVSSTGVTAIGSGVIVNADVNASAAIAGTKISPNFGSQAVTTTGTITGASLIPTSATVPTNGVFLPAANTVGIATNGSEKARITSDGVLRLAGGDTEILVQRADSSTIQVESFLTTAGTFGGRVQSTLASYYSSFLASIAPAYIVAKSQSDTIGSHAALSTSSIIGSYQFQGSDGTAFRRAAQISAFADAAFATDSTPGRIVFSTTPSGSTAPAERMRITSDGRVGIGSGSLGSVGFRVGMPITGATTSYCGFYENTVQADVTNTAYYHRTNARTVDSTFTLNSLQHYAAGQHTFGAASTVTNQYGFVAENNLTGATNNYGFFSALSVGTGRWNFYANGTAENYFAGNTGIGTNTITARLHVSGTTSVGGIYVEDASSSLGGPAVRITGKRSDGNGTAAFGGKLVLDQIRTDAAINSGKTLGSIIFGGNYNTTPDLCYPASIIGYAESDWTSASAAPAGIAFYTGSVGNASTDVAAGYGTERMRIRSNGNIGIGGSGSNVVTFYNQGATTGGANAYANFTNTVIQSDVTGTALAYSVIANTAAAAFTLANLHYYSASQGTIGASSSITNQYAFIANSTLIGATNNYGFYGNIPSGTGCWNFYANGTAPNYFAGDVRTNTVLTAKTSPTNSNTSATATAASLLDGLRTGTPAANINLTLPTGTNMDAAFQDLQANQSFEWSVINLAAATHVITVVQNTGHTVVGSMAVAAASSGRFLTRKTAANTFITYRIG